MSAPTGASYDLRKIEIEEDNLAIDEWSFQSILNAKTFYHLISDQQELYFDQKPRYLVSSRRDKKDQKYAYCVIFHCSSAAFFEDLLADFMYQQSLSKRFKPMITTFEDICLEHTTEGIRAAFIHSHPLPMSSQATNDQQILKMAGPLTKAGQLVPMLVRVVKFVQQMRDSLYYEFELDYHSIMISQNQDDTFDFSLMFPVLPLQYRIDFLTCLNEIHEEQEFEFNETLITKKIATLLFTLAKNEDPENYKQMKDELAKWKSKKGVVLPKQPLLYEIYKFSMNLLQKIEAKENVPLPYIIDSLQAITYQSQAPITDRKKNNLDKRGLKQKRGSQETLKSNQIPKSEQDSSHFPEEEGGSEVDNEEERDFLIVPVNNIDNDTVHIKVQDDDTRNHQRSQHFMMDTDNENGNNPTGGYQSDVMRSLHMLGGSSAVTIKTNKYDDPNQEKGLNTVINVDQIRVNVPSTNRDNEGEPANDEFEIDQDSELPPKLMKGGEQLKNVLFKSPGTEKTQGSIARIGVVEPNFNDLRERANYKNYGPTFVVKNAHSEQINCIVSLRGGIFATGSSDKTIKVWSPLEQKPLGVLEEDMKISHFLKIDKPTQSDIVVLYVTNQIVKYLSFRQQKSMQLFRNDREISAITQIDRDKNIVVIGSVNGMIKDYDMRNKQIIRRANYHNGSKVTAITSIGKFLISASEDGFIVVYNYQDQQLEAELNTKAVGLFNPSALLLLRENYLVVGEEMGVTVMDIDTKTVVNPTLGTKDVVSLKKLSVKNFNGTAVFVGCTMTGQVKVWQEGTQDAKWIEVIKTLKAHQGVASGVTYLPNGALVSCGHDRSICLWEEKKGGKGCAGGPCCNIF